MANIRDLNQRSGDSFWDWINQMNQGIPHRPGPSHDSTARNANEGPSQQQEPEKKQQDASGPAAESPTEKGDNVDPPTPPEEVPDDDYFFFDDHHGGGMSPPPPPPPPGPGGFPMGPPPPMGGPSFGPGHHGRHGESHEAHQGGPFGHHGGLHGMHHHGPRGPWRHHVRGGARGRGRHGRGGFGPGLFDESFGRGFPFGGPAGCGRGGMGGRGFMPMVQKFMEQFGPNGNGANREAQEDGVDFEPAIDVYETSAAYLIHVSLPGAKRDDIGVTWDESRSSLTIGGVITRDVDEKIAESLALNERDVGVFRRVVRLGDGDHPASVNSDAIAAKMEDGILKLNVPKVDGYVEVKKVQVQ